MIGDKATPCKDCEYRQVGCHASCEVYRAWRENMTASKTAAMEKAKGGKEAENFKHANIRKTIRKAGRAKKWIRH